jgi:hypothetical protein
MKSFIKTPAELLANGFVLSHKAEYQTKMMQKFNAPPMKDVFFINVAGKTTPKRVFSSPNEAIGALVAEGLKGRVYCNGEYMSVAAAGKLDLHCFSNKTDGRAPGRPQIMTEERALKLNTPAASTSSSTATPVDNTPNDKRPLF